jgi:hypothetical protein
VAAEEEEQKTKSQGGQAGYEEQARESLKSNTEIC